jgi:hypothetical protein
MQISKLKTLTTPNLTDILPILDINGGLGGKPILRKATLSSLLALVEIDNINQVPSSFTIPTTIKNVAAANDYFIGIDGNNQLYKISKSNLLAGLTSGSTPPPPPTPTQIPANAITGFDGANEFLIEVGNGYLTY